MASTRNWIEAILSGIAQIIFSDKKISGLIIFFAIFFISPMSALGAVIGVSINTIVSYKYYKDNFFLEWKKGYFGYSSGVLGIIIGSYLVHSPLYFIIFFIGVLFCSFLDRALNFFFIRYSLPTFALSSIITFWLIFIILSYNNYPFWISIGVFPLKIWSVYICIAGVLIALFLKNKKATAIMIIFSLLTIIFSNQILHLSFYQSSSLWAFNIATASYLSSIIFLPLGIVGLLIITFTTVSSLIIWLCWVYFGFWHFLPPIIAPFTLSILITIFISNKIFGPLFFSPKIWRFINLIKKYKKICVLTGAGVSTPSGIPDYVSGDWLDKKYNTKDYNFTNFIKNRSSRKIYWNVCYKFYKNYKKTKYNLIHKILFKLEKSKFFFTIITQNVDGFHQSAGSKSVIELHGNISSVSCLQCKKQYQWKKIKKNWLKKDIKCIDCLDFVKPSVIAMEQELDPFIWTRAKNTIKESKLLLVLGTQLSISSAKSLLDIARKNKIKIIVINNTQVAIPLRKDEEILYFPLEKFFKIFSIIY